MVVPQTREAEVVPQFARGRLICSASFLLSRSFALEMMND